MRKGRYAYHEVKGVTLTTPITTPLSKSELQDRLGSITLIESGGSIPCIVVGTNNPERERESKKKVTNSAGHRD